jgi:ABC-type multidrug transport system fused ATPase/permease subunit
VTDRKPARWSALVALIAPYRRLYAGLGMLIVVQTALLVSGPLLLRRLLDSVGEADTGQLTALAGAFLAVAVAGQALGLGVMWVATSLAWRAANALRLRLTGHVLGLDHDFHRHHGPGALIQRVDGDVTAVSDFLSRALVRVLGAVTLAVAVVATVAVVHWWIGIGMALYAAAAAATVATQRRLSVAESADELRSSARLYGGIEDRLTASEDLRANGGGSWALWRFVGDTIHHIGVVRRRLVSESTLWRRVHSAVVAGTVASVLIGSVAVANGWLTVGTAFLLFQFTEQLRRPLQDLIHELGVIQKATGAMDRIGQLLATRPTIVDRGCRIPPPGPLSIRFDRVGFHYGDGVPVLRDIDLHIAPGRSVGLVGHTGSGKTTLSRLLLRLVEPTEGRLELGGVPIGDIPLAELRHRVALVPQTVDLLAGTVHDNVTLFDDSVDDAAVDRALERVGLDRFRGRARLARLDAGGSGLSAGEGQLLALARVWLRPCDLVVLDEPTARVDPATEARLERAIASLFAERSVVVIAHRLSTLQQVDEIVVLEQGRIREHGDREVLEASVASRYRELLEVAGHAPVEVPS